VLLFLCASLLTACKETPPPQTAPSTKASQLPSPPPITWRQRTFQLRTDAGAGQRLVLTRHGESEVEFLLGVDGCSGVLRGTALARAGDSEIVDGASNASPATSFDYLDGSCDLAITVPSDGQSARVTAKGCNCQASSAQMPREP
jgi:hypothetical protein